MNTPQPPKPPLAPQPAAGAPPAAPQTTVSPGPSRFGTLAVPRVINLGSGRSFAPECLNLDVDPYWQPDVVVDLNEPFPQPGRDHQDFDTDRFGRIRIEKGTFERIRAIDVLEHIHELATAMTSLLGLLRVGGVLEISVPHEFSTGAWSDPTHVRAFNERSWIYYTDWYWYLGWSEARFALHKSEIVPSAWGHELFGQGAGIEDLLRTPRAVESMQVELVKVALTDEEKANLAQWRGRGSRPGSNHA